MRWPTAGSTTRSGAASPATRSTPSGSSPTSRRCSTTTRSSLARTCMGGRSLATSAGGGFARRRSTGRCAKCAGRREGSTRRPPRYAEARQVLYERRRQRVWPGLDDKRVCSWNALMVAALADAGAVLGREDYLEAARACAEHVWTRMRDDRGRLRRTWKEGGARLDAYLEDHAYLLDALLTLYEATFEARWFDAARESAELRIDRSA